MIQVLKPYYRVEECLNEIRECLECGWTGAGYKTEIFETAWREYTNLPYAHFLNSATAGLHLAVKILKEAYKWKDGAEVISTPFTFVSTNHVLLYEKLKPRFADIDFSLCLNPKKIEALINSKTKAVMFVGIGGNVGKLKEVIELCKTYHLKLILDAAHLSGTKWKDGVHVGAEADATVFSFHAVKNLPTADAGMLCFQDPELDKQARKLSWVGIDKDTYTRTSSEAAYKWKYNVDLLGYKYHGNSVLAALGLVGLKYLEEDNSYRRKLAILYDYHFRNKIGIYPIAHSNCISSRHLYQVLVKNRDQLLDQLNKKNIFPGVHYISNTSYSMYRYDLCPVAEYCSDHILSLPLHLKLEPVDIEYISKTLLKNL